MGNTLREYVENLRENRVLQTNIAAVKRTGETVSIPRDETVQFAGNLNDWRRVTIVWHSELHVISRSAWDHAMPLDNKPRPSIAQLNSRVRRQID